MSRLGSSMGANQPPAYAREAMPRWTLSHMAQSWRLTRSQKSAASEGSKPGRARSSGGNSSSRTTVVSAGPPGPLPAGREGPGALAGGDAPVPVQAGPAALERRHHPAQLGVDAGAVVALVVVLGCQVPG